MSKEKSVLKKKTLALAGVALCGVSALGACATEGVDQGDSKNLNIVASTTQICDYITQILGSEQSEIQLHRTDSQGTSVDLGASDANGAHPAEVDLTCLLAPNATAHEHEMTPQQMNALSRADLFFINGVDLEHFLDSAVESSGFTGKMVATSGLRTSEEKTDPHGAQNKSAEFPFIVEDGAEKVALEKWPFPPEGDEKDGSAFVFDPHVWTSPRNAMIQVRNIGAAMTAAAPDSADTIRNQVDQYLRRLQALDSWARESLNSVPEKNRTLFTSHDAFGYFSREYGINFIGAALSDFSGQQDATAEHIAQAAQSVKDSGAKALFAENSNNSKSVESVARAAGVRAIIGEDALYGDSLGPADSDGRTYIGSQLHNVVNLVTAWGGKPADIPAQLRDDSPEHVLV
ncbi:zinc ABC transporter solute-binding protein [Corynebacterium sp. 3HC-13]|nr:zinc ABC transporter solute-binding protein [Corynebacterium poyangense]